MSFEQPNFKPSPFKAGADLTAAQFKGVVLTGALTVGAPSSAGVSIVGVLQNKPNAGEACEIITSGISKALAGAAIAVNADVAMSNDGHFITAVSGNVVVGTALEAAAASGEIVAVLLRNLGIKP